MNATVSRCGRICARCANFAIKHDAERAAKGIGRCDAGLEPSINPWMRWDTPFCVLFVKAPNMSKRSAWIAIQTPERL